MLNIRAYTTFSPQHFASYAHRSKHNEYRRKEFRPLFDGYPKYQNLCLMMTKSQLGYVHRMSLSITNHLKQSPNKKKKVDKSIKTSSNVFHDETISMLLQPTRQIIFNPHVIVAQRYTIRKYKINEHIVLFVSSYLPWNPSTDFTSTSKFVSFTARFTSFTWRAYGVITPISTPLEFPAETQTILFSKMRRWSNVV